MIRPILAVGAFAAFCASAQAAQEFYVGEPLVREGMQIVPNYLTGIEMDHMAMGKTAVHLEADVHATNAEKHGFAEDAWIPYLTIKYMLAKPGSNFKVSGRLYPMTAGDGPRYANNIDYPSKTK